tara:strand:+ start:518 stop:1099 length:582 start_codon:yes stop_codon:yes gene_type:complete
MPRSVVSKKPKALGLPKTKYDIIYCDPPWDYKGQLQHTKTTTSGGAKTHYPTAELSVMKTWAIEKIAKDDCLLFMWTSSPHLDQAIELGKAWGFSWATVAFVWEKEKPNPGFYTMSSVEMCLVFKRGKIPSPRGTRNERQFLSEKRKKHSAKPNEIRDRIYRMFPTQKKIELFARRKTKGWTVWGNDKSIKNT